MNKRPSKLISMALFALLLAGAAPQAKAQDVSVSYQTFYDELSPYGQWVDDAEYGNVWVPNEDAGFRPYATDGHWAMTEQGNMWVSTSPYGWAAYHYGRWTYNAFYGWVWIPGYEWAPAWVSWRSGGGYYGWAPMGPGYMPGGMYDYPDNYWVFVGPQYLYEPNVYGYYQPRHVHRYIRETNYITETYVDNGYHSTYYYGPRREVIERETHQPVQVYRVSNASAPRQTNVGGGAVQIYRPMVNQETRGTARPQNVVRAAEPVGRPQEYTRRDSRVVPEFRQQQQTRAAGGSAEPARPQGGGFSGRGGNNGGSPAYQQQNNRQQPQRFQGAGGGQPQTQPVRTQPQPQMQQSQGGMRQQQFNQQPQQARPQPQQPQMQRPQPTMQQRQQPQQSGGGKTMRERGK